MNNAKQLAEKVRNLNPLHLEIGAGMMAELQMLASAVLSDIKNTPKKRFFISLALYSEGHLVFTGSHIINGEIPEASEIPEMVKNLIKKNYPEHPELVDCDPLITALNYI